MLLKLFFISKFYQEPEINDSGAARGEPFKQRNYYDMFNFLASRHRKRPQPNSGNNEQDETMHKYAM